MTRLATAPPANSATTNGTSTMPSAASFEPKICRRPGPWVNSDFSVSQPYSLPTANTPSISANTPPKNGKPSSRLPASDSGRNARRPPIASSGSSA